MKKIRTKSLRVSRRRLVMKFFSLSMFLISLAVLFSVTNMDNIGRFQADILQEDVISSVSIEKNAKDIKFNWAVRPVVEVTDLSQTAIEYSKLRLMQWNDVRGTDKTVFPVKVSSIIEKYKYVTLQQLRTSIDDPVERKKISLYRRLIRATWTATYSENDIWLPDTGTHAGIDIMGNVWTPVYSIAEWLVVQVKHSDKWFGNFIWVLHKISGDYYMSFYAHMDGFPKDLEIGDEVKRWWLVWYIWNSGNSSGAHLHLQINKVSDLQDIVNGKIFSGWYHNLEWVKKYTVNPITFIEKYQIKVNYNDDDEDEEEAENDESENKDESENGDKNEVTQGDDDEETIEDKEADTEEDNDNLLEELLAKMDAEAEDWDTEDEEAHSSAEDELVLEESEISLIESKVKLNNSFTLTVNVTPGIWNITINTSNSNLEYTKILIEDPEKESYDITFVWVREWNCNIIISDGDKVEKHKITIYEELTNEIYGINLEWWKDIYVTVPSKYTIYPVDKHGNKLTSKVDEDITVYLKNTHTDKKNYITKLSAWKSELEFDLQWLWVGEYKIIAESKKYYFTKIVNSQLFLDYSDQDEYSSNIESLVNGNVVRWENGYLRPDRTINRRELITIIWRSVLDVDYDSIKQQMDTYISNSGKFFKDVDGKAYSDPYIYAAWKEGVTKWENGYFYPSRSISKWEILLIYTRTFDILTEVNKFTLWEDLNKGEWNYDELKPVADTTKRLNLFPDINTEKFDSGMYVTRLVWFEVLKRFMNISGGKEISYNDNMDEAEEDFKNTLENVFDF